MKTLRNEFSHKTSIVQNGLGLVLSLFIVAACSPAQQSATSSSTSAAASAIDSASVTACNAQMQAAVAQLNISESSFYTGLGIAAPISDKQSQFTAGTNGKTVVIIHGFSSSPADMSDIIASVNSAGYSVVTPLLTGFGSTAAAANAATLTMWQKSVTDAVAIAKSCSSEVSLIGHSLGGALVADQLVNQGLQGIASSVLLEPALKTRYTSLNVALALMLLKSDTLSVSAFQTLTGFDAYKYLPILAPNAGQAEPAIPLRAAQTVVDLEGKFVSGSAVSLVPTLLVVSQDDYVIDPVFDASFSATHFANLQTLNYTTSDDVNHFVESAASNPQYQGMVSRILALLAAN